MMRYGAMLEEAFTGAGWEVRPFGPVAALGRIRPGSTGLAKWLGYYDKFIHFRPHLRATAGEARRLGRPFAFAIPDHSLGPYVPALADLPHVVHIHDLIAIRSALGEIPGMRTSVTGRCYQRMIRRGLRCAHHAVAVSETTAQDVARLFPELAATTTVVENGLPYPFAPMPAGTAADTVRALLDSTPAHGRPYFLHIGNNAGYKNRIGVVEIYRQWLQLAARPDHHLVLVGPAPDDRLRRAIEAIEPERRPVIVPPVSDHQLNALYQESACLVFPSLLEGFGWPIVEAQACGSPVLILDRPPMNEIAGEAGRRIPPPDQSDAWSRSGAAALEEIIRREETERQAAREAAMANATRFDPDRWRNRILDVYRSVLDRSGASGGTGRSP